MLKPEQVPDEVAKAVMHCFHTRNAAKSAIATAINAWPGVNLDAVRCGTIILHLPQEARDE